MVGVKMCPGQRCPIANFFIETYHATLPLIFHLHSIPDINAGTHHCMEAFRMMSLLKGTLSLDTIGVTARSTRTRSCGQRSCKSLRRPARPTSPECMPISTRPSTRMPLRKPRLVLFLSDWLIVISMIYNFRSQASFESNTCLSEICANGPGCAPAVDGCLLPVALCPPAAQE